MKVLIVGNGGREHALGHFLKKDSRVKELAFAPGNAGTSFLGQNLPVSASDLPGILNWCKVERPDLVVIGPEAPLCAGIVDLLEGAGFAVFGPDQSAARLEGSKVFTKNLLLQAGIPTARSEKFYKAAEAHLYSQKQPYPQVIKADGLAAGKGVIIAETPSEAARAIYEIMTLKAFGQAGASVLIEEFLEGEEMSVHAVTDGKTYRLLPSAQDHKRVFDNDQGPNTGGMGAYAPSPLMTPAAEKIIREKIFAPLLRVFHSEKITYKGVLYAGLMMTADGPKVLEFNARFGDPETQVLLPLLKTPVLDILLAVVRGELDRLSVEFLPGAAMTVVLASEGYPAKPRTGDAIKGLEKTGGLVFHAGTKIENGKTVTSGGRVLAVTATGETLRGARDAAYALIPDIHFVGMHHRMDIGAKAFQKTS